MRANRFGIFCLTAISLAFAIPPAAAADAVPAAPLASGHSTLDVSYDLTLLGLSLGKVRLRSSFEGKGYSAISSLETSGVINLFWKSQINAQSYGWFVDGAPRPSRYNSSSINHNGKHQAVALNYNPQGPPTLFADPPYKTDKYPVSDEQKKATLDPVSAMVLVTTGMSANDNDRCGSVAHVFDGARRYDVVLTYLKTMNVELDNSLYRGPAFVCQIHYRQIAGFKQKILLEGAKLPDLFAWVVPVASHGASAQHYLVPVRLWAVTGFGTVVAQASHIKLDGAAIKGQSS